MNVTTCRYGVMCSTKTIVLGVQSRVKKGQLDDYVERNQCMTKRSPSPPG